MKCPDTQLYTLSLGDPSIFPAALQNYINENCKSLKRLNNKVRTGAQVDNFLDEQLTIPPIATVEYSSSTRLKSATAAAQSQKTTTSRQLRPASSLSWNDRDLIYLQQRKVAICWCFRPCIPYGKRKNVFF